MSTPKPTVCEHLWMATNMTKAVPTYCIECKSLCFIFQKLRRCSHCSDYLHEDPCFKNRVALNAAVSASVAAAAAATASSTLSPQREEQPAENVGSANNNSASNNSSMNVTGSAASFTSSATGGEFHSPAHGQQVQQQVHIHSLFLAYSATFGSKCDICKSLIYSFGGGSHKYVMCADCDMRAHLDCWTKMQKKLDPTFDDRNQESILLTEAEFLKRQQDQARSFGETKAKVINGTLDLLKALDSRNRRWGEYVVNPYTMYRVQRKQAEIYIALCSELSSGHHQHQNKHKSLPATGTTAAATAAAPAASSSSLVPRVVLDHLIDILRFATAVYGSAYEGGYFASVVSNLFLQLARKDIVNAKPEQNNVAVANILGMPRSVILFSYWGSDLSEPTFCVIDDAARERVVLAFRGSLTEADFLTDGCAEIAPFLPENSEAAKQAAANGFPTGKAHSGILESVNKVFDNDHKLYLVDRLVNIMRGRSRETKLVVTGHSLGAGLTDLFCARALATDALCIRDEATGEVLRSTKDLLQGYAYAPPPTLTLPLAGCFDDNVVGIVAAKDCVPRLQLPAMDRLGVQMVISRRAPAPDASPDAIAKQSLQEKKRLEEYDRNNAGGAMSAANASDPQGRQQLRIEHAADVIHQREEKEDAEEEQQKPQQQHQHQQELDNDTTGTINETNVSEKEAALLKKYLRTEAELSKVLEQEECHIPGKIVFTTHPSNQDSQAHWLRRDSPLLHTVWVSQFMIANHTMDNYQQALLLSNKEVKEGDQE